MMIERLHDILNHLNEYELEGDHRYIYHPDGCTVAPTVNLEDAIKIIAELNSKLIHIRDWIADPFDDVILTDREREVIGLASRGIPVIAIANRFGIQRQAVYEAIRRALSKFNATRGCSLDLGNISEYVFGQLERIVS